MSAKDLLLPIGTIAGGAAMLLGSNSASDPKTATGLRLAGYVSLGVGGFLLLEALLKRFSASAGEIIGAPGEVPGSTTGAPEPVTEGDVLDALGIVTARILSPTPNQEVGRTAWLGDLFPASVRVINPRSVPVSVSVELAGVWDFWLYDDREFGHKFPTVTVPAKSSVDLSAQVASGFGTLEILNPFSPPEGTLRVLLDGRETDSVKFRIE